MAQDIPKKETTAVRWFFDNLNNDEIQAEHFELYKHAIAMEKEQMKQLYKEGLEDALKEFKTQLKEFLVLPNPYKK